MKTMVALACAALAVLVACDPAAAPPATPVAAVERAGLDELVVLGTPPSDAAPFRAPNADAVIRGELLLRARACWDASLTGDVPAPGRIVIHLAIAPSGEVTTATVINSVGLTPTTVDCIMTTARGLVFNPSDDKVSTMNVPIGFAGNAGKPEDRAATAMRGRVEAVRACYSTALAKDAAVEGLATYYIDTDDAGAVRSISADPTEGLPLPLLGCVADAIKATKLPPSTAFEIPIRFRVARAQKRPAP
jgi:hypothetical protein